MSTFKVGQHVSFRTGYGEEWQTGRVVRFARGGIDVSGDRDELPEIPWNVSSEDVRPLPTHVRPTVPPEARPLSHGALKR